MQVRLLQTWRGHDRGSVIDCKRSVAALLMQLGVAQPTEPEAALAEPHAENRSRGSSHVQHVERVQVHAAQ